MFKKILYVIIVIVIIVILAIMWKDSKKPEEVLPVNQMTTETQVDTTSNINKDIDSINVDGGIDADLQQVDNDIKTL